MNPPKNQWFISFLKTNKLLAGGVATLLLFWSIGPQFAINTSPSLPKGIYIHKSYESGPIKKGDIVLFYDQKVNPFAASRGYTREGEAIGKRVAAVEGDLIDVGPIEKKIVGNLTIKEPMVKDSKGRSMDIFSYKGPVPKGTVFLLGDTKDSFDSRYYGFIDKKNITATITSFIVW